MPRPESYSRCRKIHNMTNHVLKKAQMATLSLSTSLFITLLLFTAGGRGELGQGFVTRSKKQELGLTDRFHQQSLPPPSNHHHHHFPSRLQPGLLSDKFRQPVTDSAKLW